MFHKRRTWRNIWGGFIGPQGFVLYERGFHRLVYHVPGTWFTSFLHRSARGNPGLHRPISVTKQHVHETILYHTAAPNPSLRGERGAGNSRIDLPTQANFLRCARTATKAFPSTTTSRRSNHACLWVRVRVRVRVRVPGRGDGRR